MPFVSLPTSLHAPILTSRFRQGGPIGVPTRSKTQPLHFQKVMKKFIGSGDPYDHLANFKQIARAEQVYDLYTKVEGFGLTLEGRVLSWFEMLTLLGYLTYQEFERDFIVAFSKIGLKHDVLLQVHGFKQKKDN